MSTPTIITLRLYRAHLEDYLNQNKLAEYVVSVFPAELDAAERQDRRWAGSSEPCWVILKMPENHPWTQEEEERRKRQWDSRQF